MASFSWSASLTVGSSIASKGDRIILPQSALESIIQAHANAPPPALSPLPQPHIDYDPASWGPNPYEELVRSRQAELEKQQQLPSPLTFQLKNSSNRRLIHGGVKEFSAEDGLVHLPHAMLESLELSEGDTVQVQFQHLERGTYAKFRPLSHDYLDITDFRAVFEAFLRTHYTTLTKGEILTVDQQGKEYQFVMDEVKPTAEGGAQAICITDTDLVVDIEPLEGIDSEAVKRERAKRDQTLKIGVEMQGLVEVESYQRYHIDVLDRTSGIEVLVHIQELGDLDVLVSTKSPVTLQDHIWANFESLGPRRIYIPVSDQDYSNRENDFHQLHLAIYGRSGSSSSSTSTSKQHVAFSILVQYHNNNESPDSNTISSSPSSAAHLSSAAEQPNEGAPGYQPCSNCGSWIPERTMMLHGNFCMRNNVKCGRCGEVMKREELQNHFHCDHCDMHGHISEKDKHMEIYHGWYQCSCERYETPNLIELAQHRRTICQDRYILCRFCHTFVQQGGPAGDARDRIRGLQSHEANCGGRTIECQRCSQKVKLKDVQVHMQNHEYQRQTQPMPLLCSNQNCRRVKSTGPQGGMGGGLGPSSAQSNVLGLCQICFGPFWISTEDPKHQKLIQRLARKYHSQLMTGCGNQWCRNPKCATFRSGTAADSAGAQAPGLDATAAASEMMVILKEAKIGAATAVGGDDTVKQKLWLCVDESITRKNVLAEVLTEDMQGRFAIEWCIKALEVERTDMEAAAKWLSTHAPRGKF
ncbi:hypothetical protein BGW38_004656 [Lunasporangiospora selenospora]|uniref:Ubiquitin-protein ligase E3A N-terminal zinc-binding domain-containing protein n=1 Tax=Lunasporangiospora selenospora TaxID=979761 RepID=A0A9P6FPU2_9FUNG|nr:hypothetical protein BGW38_004656 [Lunasporangiospora selenospora]